MNTIQINGVTITASGNISVSNGKITVNGLDVTPDTKEITIIVNGDTDKINIDACNQITITGKVGDIKTMSGDVDVNGDVTGSISTMSGDVDCGNVGGIVKSMSGDIKHKK